MIHFDGGCTLRPFLLAFLGTQKSNYFVFNPLRTLLHIFAHTQNSTVFFSINSALFGKNTRGVGMC